MLLGAVFLFSGLAESKAQWGGPGGWGGFWGGSYWAPTPGGFGRGLGGYGSGPSSWNRPGDIPPSPAKSPLGRVNISGDVNFSGEIDLRDYQKGNEPKRNPHGLIIGSGEMTKLELTCEPNAYRQSTMGEPKVQLEFHRLVASLEVQGVNLAHPKGRFASFEDEVAQCGRIRVWLDHTRSLLLLDSANPEMRRVEWPYASSVPPSKVFVEAVSPSSGGSAFIVTMELDDSNRKGLSKLFSEPAIWDRQLISVKVPGVKKPFEDKTPVWSYAGADGK